MRKRWDKRFKQPWPKQKNACKRASTGKRPAPQWTDKGALQNSILGETPQLPRSDDPRRMTPRCRKPPQSTHGAPCCRPSRTEARPRLGDNALRSAARLELLLGGRQPQRASDADPPKAADDALAWQGNRPAAAVFARHAPRKEANQSPPTMEVFYQRKPWEMQRRLIGKSLFQAPKLKE